MPLAFKRRAKISRRFGNEEQAETIYNHCAPLALKTLRKHLTTTGA